MMNSIPVSRESKHLLTDGPQSFLSNSAPVHPVQQIQRNKYKDNEMKRRGLGFVFGHYMPQYLALEESLVSQPLRLPGLHSEKIQLEIVTGRDTDFGFEDYLCDPRLSEDHVDIHAEMETKIFGFKL